MKSEIIIIGAGIIGLYTAYKLLGHVNKITLIDKSLPGQASTWAAGGILCPLLPWNYDSKVYQFTQSANANYHALAEQLLSSTNIDIEFWRCGMSLLDDELYSDATAWCLENEFACNNTPNDFKLPDVAHVRSPKLIKALISYLKQHQVEFISNCEFMDLSLSDQCVTAIRTTSGEINTNIVINTMGAWAAQYLPKQTAISNIKPIQGQILAYNAANIQLDTILYSQGYYLIPRKDGLILVGSTLDDVGFDASLSRHAKQTLHKHALRILPALETCSIVHHWSGLRPGTDKNIPIVAADENIQGLFHNCGHHRYGVAMAPKCAELIQQQVLAL